MDSLTVMEIAVMVMMIFALGAFGASRVFESGESSGKVSSVDKPITAKVAPRVSNDGLFSWRSDLSIWQPLKPLPVGTYTPDNRFVWNGESWMPVYAGVITRQKSKMPTIAKIGIGFAIVVVAVLAAPSAFTFLLIILYLFAPGGYGGGKGR